MIRAATKILARYSHINWALTDQALISGINFLTSIILARYLGLEAFGQFTLAWLMVVFASSLQHALVIAPMMSIGPKQSEIQTPAYFGAVIAHQVALSALAFVTVFAAVELCAIAFPEWRLGGLGLPLACAAVAFQFQDFLRKYLFTRGRAAAACINSAFRYFSQIAILFGLFYGIAEYRNSESALWVIAGTGLGASAIGLFQIGHVSWDPGIVRVTAVQHWMFSKWMVGSAFMQWITGQFFFLVAGALLGTAAVGALKAAQTLLGVSHILFQGLENVVPIRAAQHFSQSGRVALTRYLTKIGIVFGSITAAIAVVVAVAPEFWLELAFGNAYRGFGHLVQWYAVIYVLAFVGLPLRAGLRAIEHTRAIFWATVWMTLFVAVFAYPLIAEFGLLGVVAGTLMMYAILNAILLYGLRTRLA